MTASQQANVTALLSELSEGNKAVVDALLPILYQELRKTAQKQIRRTKSDSTLRTTALVHEAYLKLIDQSQTSWQNRAHFLALASQAMRRIIIDHARISGAKKRGGDQIAVTFDEEIHSEVMLSTELLDLDIALDELKSNSERQAKVVEYSFFGGLTHEEIAAVLEVSLPTVHRDWRLAKAWLSRRLKQRK